MEGTTGNGHTIYMGANDTNASAVSQHTFQAELHFAIGMLSVLAVLGSVGNAIVLIVYTRKRDKSNSTIFILALAWNDFATCVIVLPFTIYMESYDFQIGNQGVVCKIYHFLITFNVPFALFIMVVIAIDRYCCICHPFKHAMTKAKAKACVFCLLVLALGIGTAIALFYGIVYKVNDIEEVTTLPNHLERTTDKSEADDEANTTHIYGGSFASFSYLKDGYTPVELRRPFVEDRKRADHIGGVIEMKGTCMPNDVIIEKKYMVVINRVYNSIFVLCFITVLILYSLILHYVSSRRRRRQQQRNSVVSRYRSRSVVSTSKFASEAEPDTDHTHVADNFTTLPPQAIDLNGTIPDEHNFMVTFLQDRANRRSVASLANNAVCIANIRTAAMLFVVTFVFIISYLPGFLMTLKIMPYHLVVFYLYFVYNAANPWIYSFMNPNFRKDLHQLFHIKRRTSL